MMRFERPPAPPDFLKKTTAKTPEQTSDAELDPIWRDFKKPLIDAQHGRCGYCDRKIDGTDYGDVEHYRPKGELREIDDPAAQKKCSNDEPPNTRKISERGYRWLAYAWDNYLFACQKCNQRFKRCLFPVEEGTRSLPLGPGSEQLEAAQLLCCYNVDDPSKHFRFDRVGSIFHESEQGRQTIITCGLDRSHLRDSRREKCEDAFDTVNQILSGNEALRNSAVERCRRKGADHADFAGVFRVIIEQVLEMPWKTALDCLEEKGEDGNNVGT